MNGFEARQLQERMEMHDANVYFMLGRYQEKKEIAEKQGNQEAVKMCDEIIVELEHIRDDEPLRKLYPYVVQNHGA